MRLYKYSDLMCCLKNHPEISEAVVLTYNQDAALTTMVSFYGDVIHKWGSAIPTRISHPGSYPGHLKILRPDYKNVILDFMTFTCENDSQLERVHFFIPDDVYQRVRKRFDLSYADKDDDNVVTLQWFIRNVYYRRVKNPKRKQSLTEELDDYLDSYGIY